jgi:hypothetical protein
MVSISSGRATFFFAKDWRSQGEKFFCLNAKCLFAPAISKNAA